MNGVNNEKKKKELSQRSYTHSPWIQAIAWGRRAGGKWAKHKHKENIKLLLNTAHGLYILNRINSKHKDNHKEILNIILWAC